jgi:hypothetical protein
MITCCRRIQRNHSFICDSLNKNDVYLPVSMIDFNSNSADNFATGLIPPITNSDPLTATNIAPLALAAGSTLLPATNTVAPAVTATTNPANPAKDPITGTGLGLLAEYYDLTFPAKSEDSR